MHLILDADAIIQLHRVGVLATVIRAFPCVVPQAVYEEVVVIGKSRLHQDAEAIESLLSGAVSVVQAPEPRRPEAGLGRGELAILELIAGESRPVVLSDDRQFLMLLSRRGVPSLTPAGMLVVLARRGTLTRAGALDTLERLKPMIRLAVYHEARNELESGGGT